MSAKILSLDLDWFNFVARSELKSEVKNFFVRLKKVCKLPRKIEYVPEHQYLYPWSVSLLQKLSKQQVSVVNIDEHHDFYCLDKVNFDAEREEVGCWNFFGFMAHREMMSDYTWVTNSADRISEYKDELIDDMRDSDSSSVHEFVRKVKVVRQQNVFKVCSGNKFDGFMIVRSPFYTENYRAVYHAVDEALASELPKARVRRHKCRSNFGEHRVRHRAKSLFWKK